MNTHRTRTSIPLVVSVLGAGFTTGIIPAGLLPANVLNIEQAYGMSHAEVGRMVGLCMVCGGTIGGLLGGLVCGRIGALRNMLLSLGMVIIALMVMGLIPHKNATFVGLTGYFLASGFMGSSNALATHMLPNRQRGVALLHGVNAIGKLAGPILASLFLYGAWRSSFLAAAVLPVVLIFTTLTAYRAGGNGHVGRRKHGDAHPGAAFWAAVAGFALIAGSEIAVALWIPAFGQKVRGFTAAQGNILLSIFLLGMISGRFASSALSDRLNSRQAMALCAISLMFVWPSVALETYWACAASFFLFGLAFSATWPSYFAHLSHVFPEHLGMMGGAAVFSTQIGFAFCSLASGRLAEINLSYPMLFGAVVMGAFAVIFFASPLSRAGKGATS